MRVAIPCGMMRAMDRDWARLAAAVKAAREARGLTQIELADRAGVAEGTVQNLESPKPRRRIPSSLAKVEPHLGWAPGSGIRILNGGHPRLNPSEAPAEPAASEARGDLPLRIVDELKGDGPLLDSAVIRLPGTRGSRMTIVVRGEPDASPEEIQAALIAWRETERKLKRLRDNDGDDPQAVTSA